jgi:hypothetical protein
MQNVFFGNSDHFLQFKEAIAISIDKSFSQWALEALKKQQILQVYQLMEILGI